MNQSARLWAVVPAAGRGDRFGSPTPKQYTDLHDRPVLSWALRALLADSSIHGIVVAIAPGDRRWERLPESRDPRVRSCAGGDSREISVSHALTALASSARDSDWVLVHDAARPCLSQVDLSKLVSSVSDDSVGGILALPLGDTLKRDDGQRRCRETVSRDGLWRALTPQMFRFGLLRRALSLCLHRGRVVTDEASAIEVVGLRPMLVPGRADNIKITTPGDRLLAGLILESGELGH